MSFKVGEQANLKDYSGLRYVSSSGIVPCDAEFYRRVKFLSSNQEDPVVVLSAHSAASGDPFISTFFGPGNDVMVVHRESGTVIFTQQKHLGSLTNPKPFSKLEAALIVNIKSQETVLNLVASRSRLQQTSNDLSLRLLEMLLEDDMFR